MIDNVEPSGPWDCSACGERQEPSFDSCWKCGTDRDGKPADAFEASVEVVPLTNCRKCGYPFRGLSSGECPECGAATVAHNTRDTADRKPASGITYVMWCMLIGAIGWAMGMAVGGSCLGDIFRGLLKWVI